MKKRPQAHIKELVHECLVWMQVSPQQEVVLAMVGVQKVLRHLWGCTALTVVH